MVELFQHSYVNAHFTVHIGCAASSGSFEPAATGALVVISCAAINRDQTARSAENNVASEQRLERKRGEKRVNEFD